MNKILEEDYQSILNDSGIPWKDFDNTAVFITGATGLIGRMLVQSLLYLSEHTDIQIKVIAMVRNLEKAHYIFKNNIMNHNLELYCGDVNYPVSYPGEVDYIIHCASITSSKCMVENPVDVITTTVNGSYHLLDFARKKQAKRFIFLSTMEIYGIPDSDDIIKENNYYYLEHLNVRSSYPESKKMVETLCVSFAKQYNLHINIARLTQTFGAGVEFTDGRAFADFARHAASNQNIILHTKGETKRSYLYTADAARAVFYILLKGENAKAYNAANEETYCTILEMASTAVSNTNLRVEVMEEDIASFGYAPKLKMNLCVDRLKELGWKPQYNLKEMFSRMIEYWRMEEKF